VIGVERLGVLDHDTARPLRVVVARTVQEVSTVGGLQRLDLARGDESLAGELSNGLQESVAGTRTGVFDLYQGLVDHAAEAVQHVLAGKQAARAHLLGGGEREAAGKHGESAQQYPLILGEQCVAPFERGPQRRMPGDLSAPTEQRERLAQPLGDLGRFEMRNACSRELQGERNAVETTADLHDGPGVARIEDEVGPDIMSAVEEESN
jgi:hypothetical protein